MKKITLILIFLAFLSNSYAQISQGGEPVNWDEKDINRFDVEFSEFEVLDMELVNAQDEISDQHKDTPFRFGIERDVDVSTSNSGAWTENTDGSKVWLYGVHCPEATSISFHFDEYELAKGAKVFIWNKERTEFLGSFTHLNNKEHGELPVSMIHTDYAVIEYIVPEGIDEGNLHLSKVVHGYRGIYNKFDAERGPYGNSGACNINVNCELGDDWQVEKKSVALIIQGGNAVCTGALVNNTANDGTPYFLTADHCLGNPENWTYLFNHESANCIGSNGPTNQTISSGTLRASNGGSDFALVELSSAPPEDYDVQFSGWDRSDNETVSEVVGIHHPSGDVKKICLDEDGAYHTNQFGAAVWYIDEWEEGVTEGGSSGSPLYDQNHRIIGQLYGGYAACSGNVNNGQADWYGRFGVSWDGASASSRLKDWLDPQNLNPEVLDGYPEGATVYDLDAGVSITTEVEGALCGWHFYPGINLSNGGLDDLTSATVTVEMNGAVTQTLNWTGALTSGQFEFIALDLQPTVQGINTLEISISEINGMEDENTGNDLSTLEFTASPTPNSTYKAEFTLDQYGSETTWEVKDGDIVYANGGPYEDGQDQMVILEEFCLSDGCYELTVYDAYSDGMCCGFGDGGFRILNQNNIELGSGGEFGESETVPFCASVTGINENSSKELLVYPNPTNGELIVSLANANSDIQVIDLTGKVVYSKVVTESGLVDLDLSGLANGTYSITVRNLESIKTQVFVKQ